MNEFRRCLIELDIPSVVGLWPIIFPGQKLDINDAATVLHYARTKTDTIPRGMRLYSHHWLIERNLPSALPDELKPRRERIYPRNVEAVGIAVKALSAASAPLAKAIELAMSDAVAEAYADGKRDPEYVKQRMNEARAKVMAS